MRCGVSRPIEQFDLWLFRELWKAQKEGRIPPVWVDEGVIRVLVNGERKRIGKNQARRLLGGESIQRILISDSRKYRWKAVRKKMHWAMESEA